MSSNAPNYATGFASGVGSAPKVAIPRLQRPHQPQGFANDRRRVARACNACRNYKIKCSGNNPQCKHCESTGRDCIYVMPRKDRLKIVTDRCVQMAKYLRILRHAASENDAIKIDELLDFVDKDMSEIPQAPTSRYSNIECDESQLLRAFSDDGAANSQGYLDVDTMEPLDENLHENNRS